MIVPRPRKNLAAPNGMPAAVDIIGSEREQLSLWFKERIDLIERESAQRIELLRTVGEHPSPLMARFVRQDGQLGLSKALVAKRLGLSIRMLEECYKDDYEMGVADVVSSVAANMIRIGTSTSDPAAAKVGMDILGRRGGEEWKPPAQKLEVVQKRADPPIIDSSKLTYEERQQMRVMLERIQAGGEGDPMEPDEDGADQALIE